jgi:hypothetical protein
MSEESDFDDLQQTEQAAKSSHFKTTFDAAVKGLFSDYTVDLTPPEESTGGGVRARQHMRLSTKSGQVVVVGSANAAAATAELRTLGCVLEISKERFGSELPIPPPEYMKFLDRATDVLRTFGMKVSVVSSAK